MDQPKLSRSRRRFLDRLVRQRGGGAEERRRRDRLRKILTYAAKEFDQTGHWPTLDMLACSVAETNGELRNFDLALLRLPPALGRVCDSERISLTALGFLLVTGPESEKAKSLTRLAEICGELKLSLKDKATIGEQILRSKYHYSDQGAWQALDLVSMLPGVSDDRGTGGYSSLSIHRTALQYRDVKEPDVLLAILQQQAADRLGLNQKRPWVWRLWRWVRLLGMALTGSSRRREETVDPGPRWLPGNTALTKESHPELISKNKARKPGAPAQLDDGPVQQDDRAYLTSLLSVYATQFGSYTTLLWQVPALSLAAQSFLMTIALSHGNSNSARLIASALSIVIAGTSISLMHNQRGHAINHGELALRVSKELGLARDLGSLAIDDAKPEFTDAESVWVGWDHGIYHVWKICLGLFIMADIIVFFLTFLFAVTGSSPNSWWS